MSALDGPASQDTISVNTTTPTEVKVGSKPFDERKVVTIQPLGKIYVYFAGQGEIPNAATVSSKGFVHFKNQKDTYEATCTQAVFILAVAGTFNVTIAERA